MGDGEVVGSAGWHFWRDEREDGPYAAEEVEKLLTLGQVTPRTLAVPHAQLHHGHWKPLQEWDWRPRAQVKEHEAREHIVKFECRQCGQHLEAPDSLLGTEITCPSCACLQSVQPRPIIFPAFTQNFFLSRTDYQVTADSAGVRLEAFDSSRTISVPGEQIPKNAALSPGLRKMTLRIQTPAETLHLWVPPAESKALEVQLTGDHYAGNPLRESYVAKVAEEAARLEENSSPLHALFSASGCLAFIIGVPIGIGTNALLLLWFGQEMSPDLRRWLPYGVCFVVWTLLRAVLEVYFEKRNAESLKQTAGIRPSLTHQATDSPQPAGTAKSQDGAAGGLAAGSPAGADHAARTLSVPEPSFAEDLGQKSPVHFCPECRTEFSVRAEPRGQAINCPVCGTPLAARKGTPAGPPGSRVSRRLWWVGSVSLLVLAAVVTVWWVRRNSPAIPIGSVDDSESAKPAETLPASPRQQPPPSAAKAQRPAPGKPSYRDTKKGWFACSYPLNWQVAELDDNANRRVRFHASDAEIRVRVPLASGSPTATLSIDELLRQQAARLFPGTKGKLLKQEKRTVASHPAYEMEYLQNTPKAHCRAVFLYAHGRLHVLAFACIRENAYVERSAQFDAFLADYQPLAGPTVAAGSPEESIRAQPVCPLSLREGQLIPAPYTIKDLAAQGTGVVVRSLTLHETGTDYLITGVGGTPLKLERKRSGGVLGSELWWRDQPFEVRVEGGKVGSFENTADYLRKGLTLPSAGRQGR